MDFFSKKCLGEIMTMEARLLKEKNSLAVCPDFTPQACHRLFSLSPLKKMPPRDLYEALQALSVECSRQ